MAGLTETGLTIKSIELLLSEIVASELANIDAGLNTEADTLIGQLNAIYAAALLELWELFEAIYHSGYVDTASGQALSYLAAITGTIRHPATKGTVTVRFFGPDTTPVPAGTECYVVGRPEMRFVSTEDVVIDGDTFWDTACEATVAGDHIYMLATDTLVIPNPPDDVSQASAIEDSLLGSAEETDAELRTRRESELARPGNSTPEAIRADVLQVTGVDIAQVYENTTMTTDAQGLPPKSMEVLVYSEDAPAYVAQEVVDAIWNAKPAGTETFGSLSGTAVDSAGENHTIYYSEPAAVVTHILVTLSYDATNYVGDNIVKDEIAAWALSALTMGTDVIASDIVALVNDLEGVVAVDGSNTGADDVTVVSGNPSLTVSFRNVATVSTLDIDVTSTAV